jgi:replicative DNA helicase
MTPEPTATTANVDPFDSAGAMAEQRFFTTGIRSLDTALPGVRPGQLVMIAGRVCVGKSSLIMNIGHALARTGHPVRVFNLQMSRDSLLGRLLGGTTRIEPSKHHTAWRLPGEKARMKQALADLSSLPMWFDSSARSAAQIREKIERLSQQERPRAIIIDDLMLLSERTDVSNTVASLKGLARELNAAAVVSSHLNPQCGLYSDHRPSLLDLPNSETTLRHVDLVMLIHERAEYRSAWLRQSEVVVAVPGNEDIVVEIGFDAKHSLFFDLPMLGAFK